jgi:GNAT superfamily N-acetyltransferase
MQLSYITYDDLTEIGNLQPEDWPDIIPEFEFYLRTKFCIPIKAKFDNSIVGVGSLIVFNHTGWLAHIIVEKKHRNRGIGSQITEKLINEGYNKSVKSFLLIATELGFPLYKKLGFRIVSEYQYFKRDNPWKDFQLSLDIIPFNDSHASAIFRMDEKISGENRRVLLADHLDKTLVYIKENSVSGFYMPDLGEGLILADTAEAGLELMKIKYSKVDKAVLPIENHTGTGFLEQNGFTLSDTRGTRMILGKDIDWKPESIYSRIGGNYG